MNKLELVTKIIAIEEGYRADVYHCTQGYPTVGIGLKVGSKDQPLEHFKGFPKMPKDVAELWCENHTKEVLHSFRNYPIITDALEECNDVQEAVLISMAYQIGVVGLSKFKNMLGCCVSGDFEKAGEEMLDSRLARQTPNRTDRQSRMLQTGILLPYYGE